MLIDSEVFIETKELLAQQLFDGVLLVVGAQCPEYNLSLLYSENAKAATGSSTMPSEHVLFPPDKDQFAEKIGVILDLSEEIEKVVDEGDP